jgi:molybdopterin-synthase adenylyltransferase
MLALDRGVTPERYGKNIGTLGLEGQRRLLASRVSVVGLGGLGGHVVEASARLGIGRIVGIDKDVFDESNLNRQLLCDTENIGASKAQQAALRVAKVNPAVEFVGHAKAFEELGDGIWRDSDLVFDCLDSISARRELAARCDEASVPLVHGAIAGWCGQVGVCPPGAGMIEKIYRGTEHGVEEGLGNLHVTAAIAANLMVAKAVPLLLGHPSREGRLVLFDLLEDDWETAEM